MKKNIIKTIIFILVFNIIMISISLAKTGTIQNSDFLNLRESASTSSNLLVKMPGDASFEILKDEGDWYQVKYQNYTGYVNKDYVKVSDDTPTTTTSTGTTTSTDSEVAPMANAKGTIKKASDVYSLPLLNSIKIGNLSANSEITVISIVGKWAYVQNANISGWVFVSNVNGKE